MYTKVGDFGQPVLAKIATVHYLYNVSLFHMRQPNQCFLAVVLITIVSTCWYEFDGVGLQEKFTQNVIASRRDRYQLDI